MNAKINKAKITLIPWTVCFIIYCGLLFVEGLFFGGNLSLSTTMLYTGLGLLAGAFVLYFVCRNSDLVSFIVCSVTQLMFLVMSSRIQDMGHIRDMGMYFFLLLMLVSVMSVSKNFRILALYLTVSMVMNVLFLIFWAPHLEWLSRFRFFMQLVMYAYASIFILMQTFNVAQKETDGEKALSAFTSLLTRTPNYMVITDKDSRVRYISKFMARFAHFSRQKFAVGQPLIDLFSDKALKLMFADILDAGGFVENVMTINTGKGERHFKVIADTLPGNDGGSFIDISDITPLINSKKQAEEARTAAEEANASKSRFLANMSHEIRTPMNAIIGIAEIELERAGIPAETQEGLRKIYNSGYTLMGIINDILDLSKIETGKFEIMPVKYDMPSLINDTVHLNIMRIASKPIDFNLNISENLPLNLIGDELRIKQILNNLLSNAFKYTERGTVTLEIGEEIPLGSGLDKDTIRLKISVRDTGQGMTAEQVNRLFDEYSRFNLDTNRLTEGTGLGMNITRNLVQMMNGNITVESEPGVGTVFNVSITQQVVGSDVIGKELVENLKNFHYSADSQMKKAQIVREYMPYGSVLIVDDVETNLFVAKGLMTPYGLKIQTALSGAEALELIHGGAVYDIIFMDHMMPKMDGMETTKRIRGAGYTNPVVALTANAITGQAEIFRKNGFDDFISKPIDIRQLNAVLNKLVRDKQSPAVLAEANTRKTSVIMSSGESREKTGEGSGPPQSVVTAADPALLAVFARDAKKALPIIETALKNIANISDEELRLFSINVHGMKSALANIGEPAVSDLAASLERAGKSGNKAAVASETEHFIQALKAIVERVESKKKDNDADITEDLPYLHEQLAVIRTACGEFDDITAKAALEKIRQSPWKKETANILDKIDEFLLHSDFEEAESAIKKYLE